MGTVPFQQTMITDLTWSRRNAGAGRECCSRAGGLESPRRGGRPRGGQATVMDTCASTGLAGLARVPRSIRWTISRDQTQADHPRLARHRRSQSRWAHALPSLQAKFSPDRPAWSRVARHIRFHLSDLGGLQASARPSRDDRAGNPTLASEPFLSWIIGESWTLCPVPDGCQRRPSSETSQLGPPETVANSI